MMKTLTVSSSKYKSFRWRIFKKTFLSPQKRVLITADGSGDDKTESEGVPDTFLPPPYNYIKITSALPETPTCEPAAEPDDLQVLEDVAVVSEKDINEEELVDLEEVYCDQDKLHVFL